MRCAATRCAGIACHVALSACQSSDEIVSRAPRAFSRAAFHAPAIALELVGSNASRSMTVLVPWRSSGTGDAQDPQQGTAGLDLVHPRVLQQPVDVRVEDSRGVVGALDVAADPEQRLGDPAQHGDLIAAARLGR